MAVKKGLGKGLDSLITDKVNTKPATSKNNPTPKSEHAADAIMMNITKVEPNREQPRKKFDEDALLELAESIKQYGVLQPLLVQEREDYYEIVAGERRWRAAKIAGIKEIPVIIKKLTRQEIMEISLIENIQREDLNRRPAVSGQCRQQNIQIAAHALISVRQVLDFLCCCPGIAPDLRINFLKIVLL